MGQRAMLSCCQQLGPNDASRNAKAKQTRAIVPDLRLSSAFCWQASIIVHVVDPTCQDESAYLYTSAPAPQVNHGKILQKIAESVRL